MNPYQSKGSPNGKARRKEKRVNADSTVEIKQEAIVKEEPNDVGMVEVMPLLSQPLITEKAIGTFKMETETDSEMSFNNDFVCVKEEVKSEDECLKEEKDSKRSGSSNGDDDQASDSPADESVSNPRSNSKYGLKKRTVDGKEPRDRKKKTNVKASKKAAISRQKKHKCHFCDYATSHKNCLKDHIRVHTGEKPFVCEVCAKCFTQKGHLRRHEMIHDPRLKIRCSKCSRRFFEETQKANHEAKCQLSQLVCHVCTFTTFSTNTMKKHMQSHTGKSPFKCSVCSKSFGLKTDLRYHSRTHVDELPISCSTCGERFAAECEMESHEKRGKCRHLECYLCEFNNSKMPNLKYHMRRKHTGEKPFECTVCGRKFGTKANMNRHSATHAKPRPIRCYKCWKLFKEEAQKNTHEGQCNRRLYQCYLCKTNEVSSANLKTHMRTHHTGEKPFSCGLCRVRFVQKFGIVRHMKRHHDSKNQH